MWKKNFRIRKLQTVMIFSVILLCSLLLCSSMNILLSLDKPLTKLVDECNSASAIAYPYPKGEEDIKNLAKKMESLKEVDKAICLKSYYIKEKITSSNNEIEAFIHLNEYNSEVFKDAKYISGSSDVAENLKDNECIIPAFIQVENNVNVGDDITIQTTSGELKYIVKGIYVDPYSTSNSFDSYILVKDIPEVFDNTYVIRLYTNDGYSTEDVESAYRDKFGGEFECQMISVEEVKYSSLIAINIVGGIILAIGIVMLFVTCLIIFYLVHHSVNTDAKTIAIYKTIGYSQRDIIKMYIIFYLFVSFVAVILGVLSSKFVSEKILSDMYANIGANANVNVLFTGIVCCLVVSVLVMLTVYFVIKRTVKVKPVLALTGFSTTNTKKKQYKGSSNLSFSPIGIAYRMMSRDIRGTVRILSIAVVTIFAIDFAVISLDIAFHTKDNNDYWLGIDKCDVVITISNSGDAEKVKELISDDNRIDKVVMNSYGNIVTLDWKKGMDSTVMYPFVYDDLSKADIYTIKGRNPENGEEIVLSDKMSKISGKQIGDYIDIYMGSTKKSMLVTGLYQTYYNMGLSCRLLAEAYENTDVDFKYNSISIYLKDGNNIETFVKEIQEKISGQGKVIKRTEEFSSITELIVKPQESAIPLVSVFIILIGAINILCIVLLKNAKEKKTNEIYKAIGYSTAHIVWSNVIYIGCLTAIATFLVLPIIVFTYPHIMTICLSMFDFMEYKARYNIMYVFGVNFIIFGTFILCTLISSKSISKINVRDLAQE